MHRLAGTPKTVAFGQFWPKAYWSSLGSGRDGPKLATWPVPGQVRPDPSKPSLLAENGQKPTGFL